MIKVGSDFSGVGAFNQALIKLGKPFKEVFACDMDKYARQTFIENYGEPEYYPTNVYDREIPTHSLDIYMTSPPCQAFSLAGKRLGKEDKRGILFFNSHEFIEVNKPRFFIFENVKGLLSDNGGKTFSEWVAMLGGKSVNGNPILFPYEDSVPYHLYWKVLNAKEHGIPQNRERVFLIGIRDDNDNKFQFPKEEHLTKRLKDVLEDPVDDKYFLSGKMLSCLFNHKSDKFQINTPVINETNQAKTLRTEMAKMRRQDNFIKVKSATNRGYEEATEGDSINFTVTNSKTRRGRVGKGIAQTLEGICNQAVIQLNQNKESGGVQPYQQNRIFDVNGISPAILANLGGDRNHNILYNDKKLNDTIAKNILKEGEIKILDTHNRKVQDNAPTLTEPHHNTTRLWDGYKIRRLTPRECFRLMDFPDSFNWTCSDSQAYKQAGNSIVVNVIYKILKQLPL
jgi:DNA (cytosine-5)-methyltransferase 1